MEILVILGMFPNTQNSYLQVAAKSGGYKHTAKSADEKGNPASMAIHLQSNDERQLQLRKIQSDDKTQFRVRLHHLEHKYVLGVIQTGSHNQRNPNAPTCEERSIEWTVSMEEQTRKAALIFAQEHVLQVCILRSNTDSSNPVPRAMVSSPSVTTSKRE